MKTMKSNSKETNRLKEPSKFVIKVANSVFVLGILFSVLVAVYAVYRKINHPEYSSTYYYSFLLFALLTSILFGLGLRKLRDELKVNMSVLFITIGISVYGFETYLEFFSEESGEAIAKQMGVPYETRTKMEVIDGLVSSGIKTYPNFLPFEIAKLNGLSTSNERIYPLGGISNITTVGSNESGYYPIIETDEHGFNNPKGLYEINKVDIVLTGASFTEGVSVHSDETISAVLRESGFTAISFGKGGNGPLIKLAALKEYAESLKPQIVLWMYHVNDFNDLKIEMESSLLKKYLINKVFTQNLLSRQEEINSVLVHYIGDWEREKERGRRLIYWAFKISRLINLRSRIDLFPATTLTRIFKDTLQKAKQMVSDWGGKMYFVYLPEYSQSFTSNHQNREFLLKIKTELDIPVIDIHSEVFATHPDPLSLFPFRMEKHYNAEGYRLVGEMISNRLKADTTFPLNSRN